MVDRHFFQSDDVVNIARSLLGVCVETNFEGIKTSGIISETEAYRAPEDKASHAFGGRRTARTETMFGQAGTSYVYLCYGIHHLFNIVTGPIDTPHAVLIRGLIPVDGIDAMKSRRKIKSFTHLTDGPGKWTKAFGISLNHNNIDLLDTNSPIKLSRAQLEINDEQIKATPRIGIDYAEEWVDVPWRFLLE